MDDGYSLSDSAMRPSAKMKPQTKAMAHSAMSLPQDAPLTPGWSGSAVRGNKGEEKSGGLLGVSYGDAPLPPQRAPPLKQVIESYFEDESLKQDRYLCDIITESPGGWVDLDVVLALRRVRALKAKRDDVIRTLRGSQRLEIWHDPVDGSSAVRRSKGRPPPKYEPTLTHRNDTNNGGTEASQPVASQRDEDGNAAPPRSTSIFPGRLQGTIAEYDDESCTASIACPQTQALFQQHVSADWREIESAAVNIGSLVSFRVELGPNGEPLARELQLRAPEATGDDEDADDDNWRPAKRRKARQQQQIEVKPGSRYVGKIKSFHHGLGLGFIACRPTFLTYGRDIAVDKAEVGTFMIGDYASFELTVDEAFGTPKGIMLQEANEADVDQEDPQSKTAKRPAAKAPTVKPASAAACSVLAGKRFIGIIKTIDDVSAIGTIECAETYEAIACDIQVIGDELAGFEVGDGVGFYVRGAKAVDLEAEEAPDPEAANFATQALGKGKAMGKGKGKFMGKSKMGKY